ncbi:hypothetical protein MYU51_010463 [Penicillium brevicompactum]
MHDRIVGLWGASHQTVSSRTTSLPVDPQISRNPRSLAQFKRSTLMPSVQINLDVLFRLSDTLTGPSAAESTQSTSHPIVNDPSIQNANPRVYPYLISAFMRVDLTLQLPQSLTVVKGTCDTRASSLPSNQAIQSVLIYWSKLPTLSKTTSTLQH